MIDIKFDKVIEAIYIKFSNKKVSESAEEKQDIILDYDEPGNIAGIEILNASKKIAQPNVVTKI